MVLHRIAQMNRRQKISIGLAFLMTYAGMSLQAGRLGANFHSNDSLPKSTKIHSHRISLSLPKPLPSHHQQLQGRKIRHSGSKAIFAPSSYRLNKY